MRPRHAKRVAKFVVHQHGKRAIVVVISAQTIGITAHAVGPNRITGC